MYIHRFIIIIILVFVHYASSWCQPCIPDVASLQGPGWHPDTFSYAYVSVPYEQIFSFRLITDTTVDLGGGPMLLILDSATFDSVTGLPPGFTWTTDRPSRTYYGGDSGCIVIQGLPQAGQEGAYLVTLWGTAYLHPQISPTTPFITVDTVSRWLFICSDSLTCPPPAYSPLVSNNTFSVHIVYGNQLILNTPVASLLFFDLSGKTILQVSHIRHAVTIPTGASIVCWSDDKTYNCLKLP